MTVTDAAVTGAGDDDPAATEGTADASVVVVRLGAGRYAIPMEAVAEVAALPGLTRVPGLPGWLPGAANWRGRILAVVDLRELLALPVTAPGPQARLAVLSVDGMAVGVVVEGVDRVLPVAPDAIEPPPVTLPASSAALIAGQLTDETGPVGVLAVDAILRLRDALPRARRGG